MNQQNTIDIDTELDFRVCKICGQINIIFEE